VKPRAGFTLLELLVATAIMGVAVVGALSAISGAMRNATRLMERDRAVLLARTKMNELAADRMAPPNQRLGGRFDPLQCGGHEAGWQAMISPFERPKQRGPGSPALERIELEVWWMAGDERRTYQIQGYRVRYLTMQDIAGTQPGVPQ
jgi:general secretion pathway protein I